MEISVLQITKMLQSMRSHVRWRPGSAERHLQKRIARGHLDVNATLEAYEQIIHTVLDDPFAHIYIYHGSDAPYICVTSIIERQHWLVIADMDCVLETAFVVDNPANYLNRPSYVSQGVVQNFR